VCPIILTDSHIIVGNGSNQGADVAMSGDVTIDDTGTTTIKTSVALAGNPTTTTQSPGDNSTKIATTAYVDAIPSGATDLDGLSDVRYDTSSEANLIIGQKVTLFTGAQQNVFIGELAGATAANSTANTSQNTAVGYKSMQGLTSGQQNTAIGRESLYSITTGYYNSAIGVNALNANTTGIANTAIGYHALLSNVSGQNNIGIAPFALTNVTGSSNIGIGYNTGATLTTGSGNILIGDSIDVSGAGVSNQINIGGVRLDLGITVTITTAALTGGGSQGSMTFTNGILTAQTPAT